METLTSSLSESSAIKCHNNGISLSVDVTVPASFNKFFNRSDMANFADYIVIMGYDEHYKALMPAQFLPFRG